jgi:hypothetical protein
MAMPEPAVETKKTTTPDINIIPGSGVEDGALPSKEALAGAAVYDGKVLPTEATPKAMKAGLGGLDDKGKLQLKASQLNVIVDDQWDEARLRGEIQMAREGRADLQVKGAVPPAEMSDVNSDPATKLDKQAATPGVIPASAVAVDIPGVTIAGEPAVAVTGASGGAVPKSHGPTATPGGAAAKSSPPHSPAPGQPARK